MTDVCVELSIYSPRWGHEDTYQIDLSRDSIEIRQGARGTKCSWQENLDPVWSGESLESILQNDSIYQPSILPRLIEHAWLSWRAGELDDADVESELIALAGWVNEITRAKPDTPFWRVYF